MKALERKFDAAAAPGQNVHFRVATYRLLRLWAATAALCVLGMFESVSTVASLSNTGVLGFMTVLVLEFFVAQAGELLANRRKLNSWQVLAFAGGDLVVALVLFGCTNSGVVKRLGELVVQHWDTAKPINDTLQILAGGMIFVTFFWDIQDVRFIRQGRRRNTA